MISESIQDIMNSLEQLEADCVYSGMMSQEAKCLVWSYETEIRVVNLVLVSPTSTDLAYYYTHLVTHNCTNLDLLAGIDEPAIQVDLKSYYRVWKRNLTIRVHRDYYADRPSGIQILHTEVYF